MALRDQEGNELNRIKPDEQVALAHARPGQPGGPPVEMGRPLSATERAERVKRQADTIEQSVKPAARQAVGPQWEVKIVRVADTGLEQLQEFCNREGLEGWEPFQVLPSLSQAGDACHWVHLKRQKR
jgi:hypothetical protein